MLHPAVGRRVETAFRANSDRFVVHCVRTQFGISAFRGKVHAAKQVLEAHVRAQGIEVRISF